MKQWIVIGSIFLVVIGGYFMFLGKGSTSSTGNSSVLNSTSNNSVQSANSPAPQVNTRTRAS